MVATREQLDAIINEHFMFEATDNVDGVMGSLAENVRHEVIPSPYGDLTDKDMIREMYTNLFSKLHGTGVDPVKRYYGDDFLIDETVWHGRVDDGQPVGCDGMLGDVSFRMLHVFEVSEGKIAREQVWIDLAALQQQLQPKS